MRCKFCNSKLTKIGPDYQCQDKRNSNYHRYITNNKDDEFLYLKDLYLVFWHLDEPFCSSYSRRGLNINLYEFNKYCRAIITDFTYQVFTKKINSGYSIIISNPTLEKSAIIKNYSFCQVDGYISPSVDKSLLENIEALI